MRKMLSLRLINSSRGCTISQTFSKTVVRLCQNNAADKAEASPMLTVYNGELTSRLKLLKYVALGTSAITLGCQPFFASKILYKYPGGLGITVSLALAGLSIISPLFLHVVTKGYVTQLRFEPEKKFFEVDTLNVLGRISTTEFTQTDVAFPDLMGPMTSLTIKSKARLIDFDKITDAEAFDHLMKYDQPVDLMLENNSNDTNK